jgi:hypothetical protein
MGRSRAGRHRTLLLPGLCAVVFGVGSLSGPSYNSGFTPFIVVGRIWRDHADSVGYSWSSWLSTPKAVSGRSSLPGLPPKSANQIVNNALFSGDF